MKGWVLGHVSPLLPHTNGKSEINIRSHREQHRCHLSLLLSNRTRALPKRNGHGSQPSVRPISPPNYQSVLTPPRSTGNTLAAYQTAAKNTTSKSPPAIAGGVFVPAPRNSTANTTTSSTTATSSPITFQGSAVGNNVLQSGLLAFAVIGGYALAMI